jgi:uncharacterized damage-inducible protein DinB
MLKELESMANKLNEARTMLKKTLDALSEEQAVARKVNPEWSIKDQVAHLAAANRGMFGIAQRMARGEDPKLPEGYDNEVFNARQVAKRKERTLAEICAEIDTTHSELLAFLDGLTPEQLALMGEHPLFGQVVLRDLLVIIYTHQIMHCKEISAQVRELTK